MHKVSSYPNGKSIYTLMTGKTDDRELFISPLLVILDGVLGKAVQFRLAAGIGSIPCSDRDQLHHAFVT